MKMTLLLSPPTFDGYDGGAGSRYQCKREVKSFWYPTWLAQLAALVPGSKLIDAPARGLTLEALLKTANDFEFLVIYTSTPSFMNDIKVAEAYKKINPDLLIGARSGSPLVVGVGMDEHFIASDQMALRQVTDRFI